jgi:hypothetical protein
MVTFWELMRWLVDNGMGEMVVADLEANGWTAENSRLWVAGRHRPRRFDVQWT